MARVNIKIYAINSSLMSTTQCQMRVKEVEKIARAHKQSITWMLVPRTENYIINLIVTSSNFPGVLTLFIYHIMNVHFALMISDIEALCV